MPHALIVEDDPNSLSGLSAILAADGFSVDTATTIAEARAALTRFIPDVVLVDLNLPDGSGLDLLQHLPAHPPGGALPVIVMTGNATVESAIEGLRHGIWDYLLKPVNIPRLRSLLARIPRPYELTEEVQTLRASLRQLGRFGSMLGRSGAIQHVYDTIEHIAPTEAAVLISGEAGTGKQIAARTLHDMSRRRKGPFITFDCRQREQRRPRIARSTACCSVTNAARSAAPSSASRACSSRRAAARCSSTKSPNCRAPQQEALLRALDSQTFMRVGGTNQVVTDFRLIASTRKMPRAAVADGSLHEDLALRLEAAARDAAAVARARRRSGADRAGDRRRVESRSGRARHGGDRPSRSRRTSCASVSRMNGRAMCANCRSACGARITRRATCWNRCAPMKRARRTAAI